MKNFNDREKIIQLTPLWKGERLPDGRPKVDEKYLKALRTLTLEEVWKPIFVKGELVYECPTLEQIRQHCKEEIEGMWDEVRRFTNPHNYYVDLSQKLWDIKHDLLKARSGARK